MELQRSKFGRRAQGVRRVWCRAPRLLWRSAPTASNGSCSMPLRTSAADQRHAGTAPSARSGHAQQPDQGRGAHQWRCRCHGRLAVLARRPALDDLWQLRACSTCWPQTASSTYSMSRSSSGCPWSLGEPFAVEGPSGPGRHHHRAVCRAGQDPALSRRREDAKGNFGSQEGDTVGLKVMETGNGHHFFYIPGCAKLDDTLRARLKDAPLAVLRRDALHQ